MEQETLLIGFQSVSQDTPSPEHLPGKSTFATERKPESPSQVVGADSHIPCQEQPGNWSSAEQSYLRPKKRGNVQIKERIQLQVGWPKAEDGEGRTLLHLVARPQRSPDHSGLNFWF